MSKGALTAHEVLPRKSAVIAGERGELRLQEPRKLVNGQRGCVKFVGKVLRAL